MNEPKVYVVHVASVSQVKTYTGTDTGPGCKQQGCGTLGWMDAAFQAILPDLSLSANTTAVIVHQT